MFDVAVIGAGIAGLTVAQQLSQVGYNVVVVEKSRGFGGRVATRRLNGTCADHGARYLEPKGELVQQLVQVLCAGKILQPWTDTFYQVAKGNLAPAPANWCPYYVAPAGMSAVGKFLATGLPIWLNRRVLGMTPIDGQKWHLTLEAPTAGDSGDLLPSELTARAVAIAIPAPQALMLLEPIATSLPLDFIDSLRYVEFDPCIAVMAGYPAGRQRDLAKREQAWRAVVFPDDAELAWVGWDSSKRSQSQQPVFVVHSTAAYAESYLDKEDLQPVGLQLLDRASEYLIPWLETPEWMQVHRWRYAFCRRPLPSSVLSAKTPVPLVCAGDWCGGNQIEGALQSGFAAASWVNRQLEELQMPPDASFWDAIASGDG